ncbi:hypothetical protein ACWEQJ_37050, partial [Streptomyces cyaneofuscatus]
MKIILTHEVSGLGTAGDVVDVKDGYARNYATASWTDWRTTGELTRSSSPCMRSTVQSPCS